MRPKNVQDGLFTVNNSNRYDVLDHVYGTASGRTRIIILMLVNITLSTAKIQ